MYYVYEKWLYPKHGIVNQFRSSKNCLPILIIYFHSRKINTKILVTFLFIRNASNKRHFCRDFSAKAKDRLFWKFSDSLFDLAPIFPFILCLCYRVNWVKNPPKLSLAKRAGNRKLTRVNHSRNDGIRKPQYNIVQLGTPYFVRFCISEILKAY